MILQELIVEEHIILLLDMTDTYNNNNSLSIICSNISISGSQDVWQCLYSNFIVGDNVVVSFYIKGSVATTGWIRFGGTDHHLVMEW